MPLDEPFSSGVCTVIWNTPDHIAAAFIFHPESMCFRFSEEAARRSKHNKLRFQLSLLLSTNTGKKALARPCIMHGLRAADSSFIIRAYWWSVVVSTGMCSLSQPKQSQTQRRHRYPRRLSTALVQLLLGLSRNDLCLPDFVEAVSTFPMR